jgi:membrane-bound ClpP family serine protease
MIYQLFSLVGAALILTAFAAHQTNRMHSEGVPYQALNLVGGIFLFVTAVSTRQYGFIILEGAWALLSALALLRITRKIEGPGIEEN